MFYSRPFKGSIAEPSSSTVLNSRPLKAQQGAFKGSIGSERVNDRRLKSKEPKTNDQMTKEPKTNDPTTQRPKEAWTKNWS